MVGASDILLTGIGISPAIYRAQNPEKSQKVRPPDPGPPKSSEKSPKSGRRAPKYWAAATVSYLWPTKTELSRKVSENQKFLGRSISVICPGSCRVTEIQITSCPSKEGFSTLPISVICTGVVPAQKSFLRLHFLIF